MAIRISTSRDFKELGIELNEHDMREVGLLLRERVVSRTRSGVDVRGNGFRGYSADYAEQKAAELGAGPVNLTVSGNMLNDITLLETTTKSVSLGWAGMGGGGALGKQTFIQRSRAMPSEEKASFNNATREFFDASEDDKEAIVEMLDTILQARMDHV